MKTKKNKIENAENCDTAKNPTDIELDSAEYDSGKNTISVEAEQNNQQITITTTKTTLAKRPWTLGAVKVNTTDESGKVKEAWVAAVVDSNGKAICCGDSPDMEFIVKLENSYDNILKLMNTAGSGIESAIDVLKDFECKKTKAFKFN